MSNQELALTINTLEELAEHEGDIIDRIQRFPNGGNLFQAHPFLLLADIGVQIGDRLRAELVRLDPYLSGLSETPYRALKNSREKLQIRYQVKGLFRVSSS